MRHLTESDLSCSRSCDFTPSARPEILKVEFSLLIVVESENDKVVKMNMSFEYAW